MSELDKLLRAGKVRIDIYPRNVRILSAKGIAMCVIRDYESVTETIERTAKRINVRYEKEYGNGK